LFVRRTHQSPILCAHLLFLGGRRCQLAPVKRCLASPGTAPALRPPPGTTSSAAVNGAHINPRRRTSVDARVRAMAACGLHSNYTPPAIHTGCGPQIADGCVTFLGTRRAPIAGSQPEAVSASAEVASNSLLIRSRVDARRVVLTPAVLCPFVMGLWPVRAFVSHLGSAPPVSQRTTRRLPCRLVADLPVLSYLLPAPMLRSLSPG